MKSTGALLFFSVGLSAVAMGCAASTENDVPTGIEDAVDASIDPQMLDERTPESLASLLLVNNATWEVLNRDVGLSERVTGTIVERRVGADKTIGTDDDVVISGIADLDEIPHVGQKTLEAIRSFATKSKYMEEANRLLFEPNPSDVVRIEVPMQLDCADLSPDAKEYASSHDLCATPTSDSIGDSEPPAPNPELIVRGNCGSSWIWIKKVDLMWGVNAFDIGAESSLGPIVFVSYAVAWTNSNTGRRDGYSGSKAQFNHRFTNHRLVHTGRGKVCGFLGGKAVLFWGGTCHFEFPTACTR